MLPAIQVLRGTAALLVLLAHLPEQIDDAGLHQIFPDMTVGVFGVDLFFVISGFIMVHATEPGASFAVARRFVVRRLIRIVPLYWVLTTIFVVLMLHAVRHVGPSVADLWHIAASYLFFPTADPASGDVVPVYPLGWTLAYEMFFYACFAVALLAPRRLSLPVLGGALTGLVVVGAVATLPFPLSYWARSQILEFVFGMGLAVAVRRGWSLSRPVAGLAVLAAIVAVPLYVPFIDAWDIVRGLAWGLPAALVVAAAVLSPRLPSTLPGRVMEALGDASYSLYLVHYAFFTAVATVLRGPLGRHAIPSTVYAAILLVGSIAASFVVYRYFERPLTRGLRRLCLAETPVVPAALPELASPVRSGA